MRQGDPATVSTELLRRLVAGDAALWLVYAPDQSAFAEGHIPGSLTGTDEQLLAALPAGAPLVVYGEDDRAGRARDLAAQLSHVGRDVRWYAGGLRAWSAAGLPVERLG